MSSGFHVGTFLLFAAVLLLVIVSISAPVWYTVGFLEANYIVDGTPLQFIFGTFGYCARGPPATQCLGSQIGYDIVGTIWSIGGQAFGSGTATNVNNITKTLILHPIGAGIAGIAFFLALCAHRIGFLFASLIASVAWIVVLVALILDFVAFTIVLKHVNDVNDINDPNVTGAHATYGVAMWLTVAAFVVLSLGEITVCCGSFTDRRRKHRSHY